MVKHADFYVSSSNLARGAVGLVDAMLSRGVIRGEEVETIGQLRNAALKIVQMAEEWEAENADSERNDPSEYVGDPGE